MKCLVWFIFAFVCFLLEKRESRKKSIQKVLFPIKWLATLDIRHQTKWWIEHSLTLQLPLISSVGTLSSSLSLSLSLTITHSFEKPILYSLLFTSMQKIVPNEIDQIRDEKSETKPGKYKIVSIMMTIWSCVMLQ